MLGAGGDEGLIGRYIVGRKVCEFYAKQFQGFNMETIVGAGQVNSRLRRL
jgi:hypothetical protein